MEDLPKIKISKSYNYVEAYLTFRCEMGCHYCINKQDGLVHYEEMPAKDWIIGLSRLVTDDIPITLGGGEPTMHTDFYDIVQGLDKPMDLLTNGDFMPLSFMGSVGAKKFKRGMPYASIRFSYHSGYTRLYELLRQVRFMQKRGYEVGIWAVAHPACINDIMFAKRIAEEEFGIDFRLKDFLGEFKGKLYGSYKYPKAVDKIAKKCLCKPSELLISPNGKLFRCHRDLYKNENSYGHILDEKVEIPDKFMPCDKYGLCNGCDIKQKFDRYQRTGHCSVEIKELESA